jgi:chaperonin cofactor prefoldin
MATLIREMQRFHNDCKNYEQVLEELSKVDESRYTKLKSTYQDFLFKVEAVDKSVEDMSSGFVAVGLQHGTFVEELKKVRLKLDKEINNAKRVIAAHTARS